MSKITQLDEKTIQRIAAGEVVERPASVVKELVENSLDADATRVSVAIDGGGVEGIRIRDDGIGMSEDELALSIREHTTSKISDIEDLEAGVGTLGFRGEALHTIGAVSRMTIRSKPRDGGVGTELQYEGGDVEAVRPAGCPEGTVVEVADLFYNTPARRKFLKTTATEFDHVNTVVTHYALANPDVAVTLEHDDREVFSTEGRGDLASTVLSVYGREVAEAMVPVGSVRSAHSPDDFPENSVEFDAPGVSVSGLVSHPETTRSTRDYLSTFVNGRYVTARVLREAVLDAYGGQLDADRYPFAVLFLDVAPDAVDVNVHPRKMEVRFDTESAVKRGVTDAIERALLENGLVRSSAPRGRSKAEQTEVTPGDSGTDESTKSADTKTTHPAVSKSNDGERDSESVANVDSSAEVESDMPGSDDVNDGVRTRSPPAASETSNSSASSATSDSSASSATSESSAPPTPPKKYDLAPGPDRNKQSSFGARKPDAWEEKSAPTGSPSPAESTERSSSYSTSHRVSAPTTQQDLSGDEASLEPTFETLPSMRILGQHMDTYIVAETSEGLVLIDQHAADERVNYERLQSEVAGDTPTQALAEPVELELTAREAALFEEYREALARVGFHAGRTDDRTVSVRTVPAVFDAALAPNLLRDALTAFVQEERDGGQQTVDAVADELLADLACYPSITGNTSLREGSVLDLLSALDACDNPYACPHGRPVIIEFDREEIEARFERDYPGHSGRRAED